MRRRADRAIPALVPAGVFTGYLALAVAWTARLWVDPAARQPPNPPDVALFTWFLTWAAHPAATLHAGQLNVPDGVNVMWQTSLLLPGLLLAPLTRAAGAQLTYTVLLTLGPALSAFSAYVALRRLARCGRGAAPAGGTAGPVLGGLLYGFGPAMAAQAYGGHLQFTLAFLPPLLLLLATEALLGVRPALRTGVLVGLLAAAQVLIGAELLLITALAGLGILLLIRPPWSRVRGLLAGGVPAGLLLAGWPLAVLLAGPGAAHGNIQQTGHFQEDLAGLVVPTPLLVLRPAAALSDRFPTGVQERTSYLGVLLLALAVAVAVRGWSDRRVRAAAVLAGGMSVLALGADLRVLGFRTGLPLPWAPVERAPVVGNVLPSRFPLLVALGVAALLSLAAQREGLRGVAAGAVALVLLVPRPLPAVAVPAVPPYFADRPTGTLLVLPFPTPTRTEAMRWQAAAQLSFAMPGGFFVGPGRTGRAQFGPVPTPTSRLLARAGAGRGTPIGPRERAAFRRDVRRWQVDAAVLGPGAHRDVLRATVTALVGRPPVQRGGVDLWPLPSLP